MPWNVDAQQRLELVGRELAQAVERIRTGCLLASLGGPDDCAITFTCQDGFVSLQPNGRWQTAVQTRVTTDSRRAVH